MDHVDCIIIGAGVIGLAIAREQALSGKEVLVLEKAFTIGSETSSRNSEVIHSGLYYPQDSLKARLCVQGRDLLYTYCMSHHIPHKAVGKLIVATDDSQLPALETLKNKGITNGIKDLKHLSQKELSALEPHIQGVSALYSPSTGIVDSHGFMLSLQGEIEKKGGSIAFGCEVISGTVQNNHSTLAVLCDGKATSISCSILVNAAGLYASKVANTLQGLDKTLIPKTTFCKGSYFSLNGKSPFKHLVYPLPAKDGLGIHSTVDLGGRTRFGPDTEWVTEIDYKVTEDRLAGFKESISTYWPGVKERELSGDYAGIRPKVKAPHDFIIQGPETHHIDGLMNLYGIESPGLTASLAIAKRVVQKVTG